MPTPPMLPNGKPAREMINIFGLPKIGKTHQFFNIARWHQELESDAMFYAINTDNRFGVVHAGDDFEHLTNMVYEDCQSIGDAYALAKSYHGVLRNQDWMCVDLQDDLWAYCQDEYAKLRSKAVGVDMDTVGELYAASGDTTKYPISGWEWQTPNARFRGLANTFLVRGKGHRFIISRQADIMEPSAGMKEDALTKMARQMFGHIGVKPAGQKEDPFRWNSVLHITGAGERKQRIATAGEGWKRRRWMGEKLTSGQVRGEDLKDFFLDYLVGVAGWEM